MPGDSQDASAMTCVVCGSTDFVTACASSDRLGLTAEEFEVRRCAGCGLGVTWPPAVESELARFYPDEYWGESAEPTQEWIERSQREKTDFVSDALPGGGRILDVGCGAGFFLRALDRSKWDRRGVEISARSAAVAERHVGSGRIFAGRLVDAPFEPGSFDLVAFWASLEHVTDPRPNLRTAHCLLADGGQLVVQVPNFASYQSRRFGGDWFALDLPRHRFHFSPETIERLVRGEGFEPVTLRHRSETHDPHALKQSLKTRLVHRQAPLGRARYYAAAPFLKIVDRIAGGATLTLLARKV